MADPFSIIGLLGVVEQIVENCVKLGINWKDIPSDAKKFIEELLALKTTLSVTHTNLVLNRNFVEAFKGQPSAVLAYYGGLGADTSAMVTICKAELEKGLKRLTKLAVGNPVERLKAAFQSEKTRQAVEQLYRQCQALNNAVSIDTAAIGANIMKEIGEGRQEQRENEASRFRSEVLEWLSPINHSAKHLEVTKKYLQGTGQWFLNAFEYRNWINSTGQTLFCPGIPGGGKTTLTLLVVDDLNNRFHDDPETGIAYLYCDFKSYKGKTVDDLLGSLLKQLVQRMPSVPESVQSFYEQCNAGRGPLLGDGWSGTLRSVVETFNRVFFHC